MKEYTTISEAAMSELVIKKSRFYGQLFPAESFEQAQEILEQVRKKYWDATHHCSAMILGKDREFMRCSDDGEPQGTAGIPMLETLKQSGLTDVLAIVTRYFGGTLLGAGGLVRAYTAGVSEAVQAAKKILRQPHLVFAMEMPFKLWGKAESQVIRAGYSVKVLSYTDIVSVQAYAGMEEEERFTKLILEISSGTVVPQKIGEEYVDMKI